MTFTTYLGNKILDKLYGKQAFTSPEYLYFGLCTGCTLAGVVTGEPSGSGYARAEICNQLASHEGCDAVWTLASNGQKTNNSSDGNPIVFPTATGSWGRLTTLFIADAASGGNVWVYGNLCASFAPVTGNAPSIPIGAFIEEIV
jgi:hypothetical protein